MKSNINRRKEIFKDVLPPEGSKEYFETIKLLEEREKRNPHIKALTKKLWEKAVKSLEAQSLSHSGFITEKTLRHFLMEYNNRAWSYGLRSMPVLFNIIEAFFIFRKPEVYFELIEDENYLISYFDFIDFITSKDFIANKKLLDETITPDIVYNFNIGKDLEEIKFKTDDNNEFIIAGISIIRRGDEITVLAITGKKGIEEIKPNLKDFNFADHPNKKKMITEFKESIKGKDFEYEYIDDNRKYIKVLAVCRIDLETLTIDARYIAEETNFSFNIITDEIDSFIDAKGNLKPEYEDLYKNNIKRIDNFNAIFEAVKISLYLPYYFNLNENKIIEETLDTELKKQTTNPITKRKFNNVLGFKCSLKPLYSLDINNGLQPDIIKLRDDLFKIETSGYWKKLGFDEIGLDKKGNSIHGKTWVNQSLSWFEAKAEDLILKKDKVIFTDTNSGYIYILRNPIMDANIFKIGLTRNTVDERINQLSKTSVPDRFYKSQEWNVKDCVAAEKEIHLSLKDYRIDSRREFFKIDYDKAVAVITDVIKEINTK